MTQRDLDWLSGILEGEGSFCTQKIAPDSHRARPSITFVSTDRDVSARVALLMGTKLYGPYNHRSNIGNKPTYQVGVYWETARELMRVLYPLMGERRQNTIQGVLERTQKKIKEPVLIVCHPEHRRHILGVCSPCYQRNKRKEHKRT